MIVVGYQGIGKSTLARNSVGCIDLESGNFWVNGKRADDWYIPYCKIAEDLSRQHFTVFVSSHEVVRKQLENSKEFVFCIVPAPNEDMKRDWINRLKYRYDQSGLEKDYKALKNAEDRYMENVNEIINGKLPCVTLVTMDYELEQIIMEAYYNPAINGAANHSTE
jgi:hypothetical protein